MSTRNHRTLAVLIGSLLLTACGGGGGSTPPGGTNQPPVVTVKPGSTETMELMATSIGVDATDPDGDTLTYQWTQTAGTPTDFSVSNDATITFTAPKVTDSETLSFAVDVSDGEGHTVTEDIDLLVSEGETVVMLASLAQDNALEAFRVHETDTAPVHLATPLPIVDNSFFDAFNPQISPDRKHVAWIAETENGKELMVAAIDGAGARSLTPNLDPAVNEDVQDFKWSPNSQSILYSKDRNVTGESLFVVAMDSADGGDVRRVSGDNSGAATISYFGWSPDGTQIAFIGSHIKDLTRRAFLVDAISTDGSDRRDVSGEIAVDEDAGTIAAWSPDEDISQFVFPHSTGGSTNGLYAVPADAADGVNPEQWVDETVIAEFVNITGFGFSPDGAYLAFAGVPAADPDKRELYVIKSDGTDLRRVSGDTLTTDALSGFKWSPDSKSLAFVGDFETDDVRELFVVGRASSDRRKVSGTLTDFDVPPDDNVDGDVNSIQFYWSPDSNQLAFRGRSIARPARNDIFIVSAAGDGSDRRLVSGAAMDFDTDGNTDSNFTNPRWSLDGSHLYFTGNVSRRFRDELLKVAADSTDGGDRVSVSGVPAPEFGFVSQFDVGGPSD